MPSKNLRQTLVAGLLKLGYRLATDYGSSHYLVFRDPENDKNVLSGEKSHLFVGANGALRRGPVVSRSYSLKSGHPSSLYQRILQAGIAALETKPTAPSKSP